MTKKEQKEQKEQTALAVKEQAQLAEYGDLQDSMPVAAQDIMLSKMLAMQGLSKLVQEEKAKLGEIRDSISSKLLVEKGKDIEVILFNPFKTWIIFQVIDGKETYKETIAHDEHNASWEREIIVNGTKFVRYECLNYYSLLPSEIKEGDYRPRVLSLRSTNYKTAKKIETTRAFLSKARIPLAFRVFNLSTSLQKNDKGSWYMLDVAEGRKSEDTELAAVREWVGLITANKDRVTVDDSDLATGEADRETRHQAGEVRDTDKY